MSHYIYAWISVAVLATLAELMVPGGQQGKTVGHLRFVAGLCVLIALLPTLKEGVSRLYEITEGSYDITLPEGEDAAEVYDAYFSDNMAAITREQYEAWVYGALSQAFSLSRDQVWAVIHMRAEEGLPELVSVEICLIGTGILKNPHQIKAYMEEHLSVPCTVSASLS